ncbi:ubiquitin-conjugating enzyme/RWD-like protein [Chytridium lagenaria]|nr:ubiquitin-conjugating enzyme/RWD-like protein [Chytridium lagenaria]
MMANPQTRTPHLGSSKPEPAGAVMKRLQSELMQLMMNGVPGVSAFPDPENILNWYGTIVGPVGTVRYTSFHENCGDSLPRFTRVFLQALSQVPNQLPIQRSHHSFRHPMFHPNVDTAGNICLDILKDKWSAIYNVQTVLLSLQSLLGEPNNDSPLNAQAAQMWDKPKAYKEMVHRFFSQTR